MRLFGVEYLMRIAPLLLAAAVPLLASPPAAPAEKPNVVYILADDLGYGDVKALNPEGKIATPRLDRMAAQGMSFTDAHSGSSVCTPTRYGVLTGRYSWRTRLQNGVLMGYSPPLIEPGRMTVASLLKKNGYATACVGKWHLGMEMAKKAGGKGDEKDEGKGIDYTAPIRNGPVAAGFDYYYGISASLDMPPFVFIENDRFTAIADVQKQWLRKGPAAKDFEAIDVLPTLVKKAVAFIESKAPDAKTGKPFFLYLPLNSPHTPIVPSPEWQGKSGISPYADFVMQTDAAAGQVLDAIDRAGVGENTLVIFTSDNGCSPAADLPTLNKHGHEPSGPLRGHKADIWDGGHRVPFLVRWPAAVKAGSRCERTVCHTDLLATCADLAGATLPDDAGEDSVSLLPLLRGAEAPPRPPVVHHSIAGRFSIREGRWKLELCPGSGGWGSPKDPEAAKQGLPPVQLYDMAADLGEKANLQEKHPDVVERLTKLLEKFVADGRSTPGAPQKNDVAVDVWKRKVERATSGARE
jgi:arylsulfatase A-like enzyme